MKNLVFVLIFLSLGIITINAQPTRNGPPPTPTPESPIDPSRQQDISSRSDNLRLSETLPVQPVNTNNKTFREKIRPIYRKTNKEERQLLAPNSEDASKFAEFLKGKDTGLIKLIADKGCDKNVGVVDSRPHCVEYSMPGGGSSYSFRYEDYRIRFLGDLQFTGKSFQSVGVMTHGIFVNIGDVPLETVGLDTNGVTFLKEISPAETFSEAQSLIEKLEKGIIDGDFLYKNNVPVAENTTYILRSIAYKGNSIRTVDGISFDELEFDKRKDVTVAFRVVRVESDESVTILWKELDSQKSPKIKADK